MKQCPKGFRFGKGYLSSGGCITCVHDKTCSDIFFAYKRQKTAEKFIYDFASTIMDKVGFSLDEYNKGIRGFYNDSKA